MLDRIQHAAQTFLSAIHTPSRARVEERLRAQQAQEAQTLSDEARWNAAFSEWCAGCGANKYLLPWLDRCIEDARLASRNKISSPYENAHLQGVEDGVRAVRDRLTHRDATNTVKSKRQDPE